MLLADCFLEMFDDFSAEDILELPLIIDDVLDGFLLNCVCFLYSMSRVWTMS